MTISSPPIGAIAFGRFGNSGIITALEADRIVLRCPDGVRRVPITAIARWEMPPLPKPLGSGDRVRLRGTQLTYTITEIYSHFMGWQDGNRTYEQWARLQTDDGRPAHWKLQQLEAAA